MVEEARDGLKAEDVFYYADEFNLSWFPTLRAMWSPVGQQVMIPTLTQPDKYYGFGAVNYHTGETIMQFQRHKRHKEIAQLLEALLKKHPTEPSMSPGTMPIRMRMTKWRKSCEQQQGGWSCSTCQRTARGSIPSKCFGGIFGGR